MQHFSTAPKEMVASLWRNRNLIKALVKREVIGRYRGSVLGIFWSFFNPVFMLAVYTFVFSVVFKARWSTTCLAGDSSGSETNLQGAVAIRSGPSIQLAGSTKSSAHRRAPTCAAENWWDSSIPSREGFIQTHVLEAFP